ncbi:MAG: transglutaminase domain-containing protein [Gemmatimonadota bacterium]|nr:MAG: transglutaminase domain-containing protein [Gemmatimonadota bacterium]
MVSRRRRQLIGGAIVIAWVVVLAWHVRREYFRPIAVRLSEASANLMPSHSFYSIKLGGAPIGYASSRIDTLTGGFILEDDLRLRITALGSQAPASARTQIKLGETLQLENFQFALRSDFGDFRVAGAMDGDTLLKLEIDAGGDRQDLSVPTDGPVLLPQVMPVHFVLGEEPRTGVIYAFEVFDPSVMERQRVTMEVLGRETLIYPDSVEYDESVGQWIPQTLDTVETWHVRQGFGGVELESWLDPDGLVVRATSPLGYTIERTAFEIAWNDYRQLELSGVAPAGLDATDIIEHTAISVGAEMPAGDRLAGLTVRLGNVDLEGFDLEGDRQRLSGDTLRVLAEARPAGVSYRLPADRDDWDAELAATPLIQTADPAIRRTAERVIAGESDPVRAAERLTSWVYESLGKEITLSVPSARQVLEMRRGDCNEHTVLYVALARSAGIPARTATGLVYVRDRFYYHAWPEVWLDRWVPVDPTLGQFPADASHIRFVTGGLARQVELVRLIGLLQLDVLSVEER